MKKRSLLQTLGLLGVVSLLSYAAAVVFAPLAYPGYDWMRQAVSDLSAADASSRTLWNRISSLYGVCAVVSATLACIFAQGKLNRPLRLGISLFAIMNWVSFVGYEMFPLSESGYAGTFQDLMHMVVTAAVVLLSIVSLALLIVGGFHRRAYPSLAVWACAALALMSIGAIGTGAAPANLFGVFERFSLFAAVGFTAALGIYLFNGFSGMREAEKGA
ncbi:MAG TPA: DUF998 domain-containing protein [Eubacteriales bacterium]|nr:DUF998 domain-containing protein [Eubacteriales bacterium]